jgi:hypothetical protein
MNRSVTSMVVASVLCMCAGLAVAQDGQPPKKAKPAAPAQVTKPAAQPAAAQPAAQKPDGAHGDGQTPAQGHGMPQMSPEEAAMMQKWQAYMTPGPAHAHFAKSAGAWDAKVSWRMDPNQPWATENGSETRQVIMNGLFVQSHFKGTMMGQPFDGMLIEGYNNMTKQIESVWIDSMGSGMMVQTGEMSSDGKTINMSGSCSDPMSGQTKKLRSVVEITDENAHVVRFYDTGKDGKEFESMKIEYTRSAAQVPAKSLGEEHGQVPTPAAGGQGGAHGGDHGGEQGGQHAMPK